MIQRIQSIFLFITFVCFTVIFFFPVAKYYEYIFFITGLTKLTPVPSISISVNTLPLIIIAVLIGLGALVNIFLYKNMQRQVLIVKILFLLNLLFVVVIFFYTDNIEAKLGTKTNFTFLSILPLITMVLIYLSGTYINKDIQKIKSADRLR
ncbi:MAG: DUF4293 domain-containing protein [Bacteroidales bacterium]|nr:DUF4293 domain-containing protein [Bacteroidales bacterium]